MKRVRTILISLLCVGLCACGSSAPTKSEGVQATTLTVFAAASLTETLQEIANQYGETHQEIEIVFNFDSSGTLKTQIEQGAVCDIFFSAAQKQMNQLDKPTEENPDGLDLIDSDTRVNLLENQVVLIVPQDSTASIDSFEDVATDTVRRIALGNADVPVGQYAEQIFTSLALWDEIQDKISFASNVKEVLAQVESGSVDCGVVYATDVLPTSQVEIVTSAPEDTYERALYPAAVLKNSQFPEQAEEFLKYLSTKEATQIFEAAGFTATDG